MHFEDATKQQLITIIYHEDCPLDYKYEAAAELQMRSWHDDYLSDLIKLWGRGLSVIEISVELGVDAQKIRWQLGKHDLYGRRVSNGFNKAV